MVLLRLSNSVAVRAAVRLTVRHVLASFNVCFQMRLVFVAAGTLMHPHGSQCLASCSCSGSITRFELHYTI